MINNRDMSDKTFILIVMFLEAVILISSILWFGNNYCVRVHEKSGNPNSVEGWYSSRYVCLGISLPSQGGEYKDENGTVIWVN